MESTPVEQPESPADDDVQPSDPAPADDVAPPGPEPEGDAQETPPPDAPAVGDEAETVAPVLVDQYTRRSDADVLPGHFARVTAGEHAGKVGVFEAVVANAPDGYPDTVEVTLRESGERIVCAYADLTPEQFGGR